MKKNDYELYWEDIAERLLFAEIDDNAWKLAEKAFGYKKQRSLYIFLNGKLSAYYSTQDSNNEAIVGYKYFSNYKNVQKIIKLKKKVYVQTIKTLKPLIKINLSKLTLKSLHANTLICLNLFLKALSIHYLSQPQFFKAFENKTESYKKHFLPLSKARLEFSRRAWTIAMNAAKKYLKEIAVRKNITQEQLQSASYKELLKLSWQEEILKKRGRTFVLLSTHHKQKILVGRPALRYVKKYEKYRRLNKVHGICGNDGYVKNKAFVVKNENLNLNKLPEGMKVKMVLIVQNAWPEFAPLYKKASALVTNEGGITSHGVIVAREFNIPCIVGTKFATKVFKNGDLVEVDANKGTVKKL